MNSELLGTIRDWFSSVGGGSLYLPNGWFGRPYDGIHQLTYIEHRPHKLLMELDNQLLLVFTDLGSVDVKEDVKETELVLTGFVQLVFDWQEYVSLVPHVEIYRSGVVRIVRLKVSPSVQHTIR